MPSNSSGSNGPIPAWWDHEVEYKTVLLAVLEEACSALTEAVTALRDDDYHAFVATSKKFSRIRSAGLSWLRGAES